MLPEVQGEMDKVKSFAGTAIKKKAVASKDKLRSVIGKLELYMTTVK